MIIWTLKRLLPPFSSYQSPGTVALLEWRHMLNVRPTRILVYSQQWWGVTNQKQRHSTNLTAFIRKGDSRSAFVKKSVAFPMTSYCVQQVAVYCCNTTLYNTLQCVLYTTIHYFGTMDTFHISGVLRSRCNHSRYISIVVNARYNFFGKISKEIYCVMLVRLKRQMKPRLWCFYLVLSVNVFSQIRLSR